MKTETVSTTFTSEQYNQSYSVGSELHYWNYARNRIILRHVENFIFEFNDKNILVVDVGCGPGATVSFLRNHNINCYGVELGQPIIRAGLSECVFTGIEPQNLPSFIRDEAQLILLLDVIEHLPDPTMFIDSLKMTFPKLKTLIITVPARKELWSNYDVYFGHHRRYNNPEIKELVIAVNAKSYSSKYFFQLLYLPALLLAKTTGIRSLETKAPSILMRPLYALVGSLLSIMERLPFSGAIIGTSIIARLNF